MPVELFTVFLLLGHHCYIAYFPPPSSAQTDAGGKWLLLISKGSDTSEILYTLAEITKSEITIFAENNC